MKGDFSRTTYRPSRHYTAVLKQQGRVDLDADWNEQAAIHRQQIATRTADVLGLSGGVDSSVVAALLSRAIGRKLTCVFVDNGLLRKDERVLVQGLNMVKRHQRPSQVSPGGIMDKEAPLHISNVALVDPKTDRPTRVGYKTVEGERKVRFATRSGEVIDS